MQSVGHEWKLHGLGVPCQWVSGQRPGTQKESTPMNIKNVAVALVTLIASSAAQAQDGPPMPPEPPMQWRVADGGNGHWYGVGPSMLPWLSARSATALPQQVLACGFARPVMSPQPPDADSSRRSARPCQPHLNLR